MACSRRRGPRRCSDPTFGDFVFVTVFNSANGIPVPQTTHQHGPIVMDTVDYKIPIPHNHPSGLFWFHPHVHGIALNQVVAGHVRDSSPSAASATTSAAMRRSRRLPDANVRHLMLKEIQVLAGGTIGFDSGPQPVANGEVLNQEDPDFCAPVSRRATRCARVHARARTIRRRRQQLHRRQMVLHRQRTAIPDRPDHGAGRRDLAHRHRRRQPELRPATRR